MYHVITTAVFFLLTILADGEITAGQTIYVDADGPNDPGTGSYEDPFRKIQDAIDAAESNDTVIVSTGVYYPEDPNGYNCGGKAVFIRSTDPNDPEIAENTIIDPNYTGRAFSFNGPEEANCVIAGFTITDCNTKGSGGAVYCLNSGPTIRNCVIIKNISNWGGGAIYCNEAEITLLNCIIASNYAGTTGGAVRCVMSDPLIENCTIVGNSAQYSGGAIYCLGSIPVIKNTIIWSNSSEQIHVFDENPIVTYSAIEGSWPGTGNIDTDPCFVYFNEFEDICLSDFHLKSAWGRWDPNSKSWVNDTDTSPCIDAGDPNSDYSAELWPNGRRVNMGSYGNTRYAGKNGNLCDLTLDGKVDFNDFSLVADKWMTEYDGIENLDNNGLVDFADILIFTQHWLWHR